MLPHRFVGYLRWICFLDSFPAKIMLSYANSKCNTTGARGATRMPWIDFATIASSGLQLIIIEKETKVTQPITILIQDGGKPN